MRFSAWHSLALLALFCTGWVNADELEYALAPPPAEKQSCDPCNCGDYCCKAPLLGFIQPTDICWSNFISPMTNPVFFEDPRTLSELRFIFLDNRIPALAGGAIPASNARVIAMQARAALTDNLSFVAAKDGYIFASPNAPLDDGWADVSAGLKYNLWKDVELQRILSIGGAYELPVGTPRALQGNGSGEFNLYGAYGMQVGAWNHFLTTSGFRLPADRSAENQVFYWSGHVDRQIAGNWLYGFLECNWYHWMSNGKNAAFNGIQGVDLFNFGSTGVAGSDIVTGAFGLKWKPNVLDEVGIAYELPMTDSRGILQNRLTVDYILRY